MVRSQAPEPWISPHRLEALGDGVFAIVMTLLVFQLGVPQPAEGESLGRALVAMWPDFAVYVLSFLVLGVFWVIHHVLFDLIERYDTSLVWLNIAYLLFSALVPFSTSLFAEFGATATTAVVYGLNMMTVFATGWAIFAYATHDRRLVAPDLDPEIIRRGNVMGLAYMAIMLLSVAVSFLSPVSAFVMYGLVVAANIVATVLGAGELVMLWPPRRDRPEQRRLVRS